MFQSRLLTTFFIITALVFALLMPADIFAEEEENVPPVLLNENEPILSPSNPRTFENLNINYTYFDQNQDPEKGTIIKWYKYGEVDPVKTNTYEEGDLMAKILSSSYTSKGEEWYATVQPKDGKDYGEIYTSNTVTVVNSAPFLIDGVSIAPAEPAPGDSLEAAYAFHDFDGDEEEGSQIRWYMDGVLQDVYNDLEQVPSEATSGGQQWKVELKPCDGEDFGNLYVSEPVTVNTAPYVENAVILPENPKTDHNLELQYDFHDADGDSEQGTSIKWYRDGEYREGLDDLTEVLAEETEKYQIWYATIKPSDGMSSGESVSTEETVIQNTPPILSNAQIIPEEAYTADTLTLDYSYTDADGDDKQDIELRWYLNNSEVGSLDDKLAVDSKMTEKDQQWHATIRISDGTDFSLLHTSPKITVLNSYPVAEDVEIIPSEPDSNDSLKLSYAFWDADGDKEEDTQIKWYRNGEMVSKLDGLEVVCSSYTQPGEEWMAVVVPGDGISSGPEVGSDIIKVAVPVKEPAPVSPPACADEFEQKEYKQHPEKITDGISAPAPENGLKDSLKADSAQQVSFDYENLIVDFGREFKNLEARISFSIEDRNNFYKDLGFHYASKIYSYFFTQNKAERSKVSIRCGGGHGKILVYLDSLQGKWIAAEGIKYDDGYISGMVPHADNVSVCVLEDRWLSKFVYADGKSQVFFCFGDFFFKLVVPEKLPRGTILEGSKYEGGVYLFRFLDSNGNIVDFQGMVKAYCRFLVEDIPILISIGADGNYQKLSCKQTAYKTLEADIYPGKVIGVIMP